MINHTPKPVSHKHTDGFTIVELLIATAVFSTVLLLSLTGFLQIGQLFYKGVTVAQTSSTARQILDGIKGDISFDTGPTPLYIQPPILTLRVPTPPPFALGAPSMLDRGYFCAGTNRYGYLLGQALTRSKEVLMFANNPNPKTWDQFALLTDTVAIGTCPDPFNGPKPTEFKSANVQELLGDNMRVSNFVLKSLAPTNPNLYYLQIKIAYGDNVVFTSIPNAYSTTPTCASNTGGSHFCFWTQLSTIVKRGF